MEISLTSMVDYLSKAGTPKITCVRRIKEQFEDEYKHYEDYYKQFREAVVDLHTNGLPKKDLPKLIGYPSKNKIRNYQVMTEAYQKWLGKKEIVWVGQKRGKWKYEDLTININPELGIEIDGKLHFIKLYLKSDKLTKDKASGILALLNKTLRVKNATIGLLDVRNGKLHLHDPEMDELMFLIEAEALAFIKLYNDL